MNRFRLLLNLICAYFIFFAASAFPQSTSHDKDGYIIKDTPLQSSIAPPHKFDHTGSEYSVWEIYTGIIDATLSDGGVIGVGLSRFITPSGSRCEYLHTSGIWFGCTRAGEAPVSTTVDPWQTMAEFKHAREGKTIDYISDYSFWTLFADTIQLPDFYDEAVHTILNLRCVLKAHYWYGDHIGNAIIFDLIITNIGNEAIENGYIGLYIDADVGYKITEGYWWEDDLIGSLPDYNIAYFIDNDGDHEYPDAYDSTSMSKTMAVKFLQNSFNAADTSFNWWLHDAPDSLSYGPRLVDQSGTPICLFPDSLENAVRTGIPRCDEDRYCLLSNGEWDYDLVQLIQPPFGWETPPSEISAQYLNGELKTDIMGLVSLGPANLLPDSSIRAFFTFFTGDSVHTAVNNVNNLPHDPDLYRANLNFDHVITNAELADSLAGLLLDPELPVTGLFVSHNDVDSVVIEWDPWVFNDVDGYDILLYEVPDDSLLFPGILPHWLAPDISAFIDYRQPGPTYRCRVDSLSRHHHYFVTAAHLLPNGVGAYSPPIRLQANGPIPAPEPLDTIVYFSASEPLIIEWTASPDVAVEHYNIYKFPSWDQAADRYYPFYDRLDFSPNRIPKDSIWIDDVWYYYYGMTAHEQIPAGQTSFSEYTGENAIYIITAVDSSGYESEFSKEVLAFEAGYPEKDILVITARAGYAFVEVDSVISFYDSILQDYDYDTYDLIDSLMAYDQDSLYILRRKLDFLPYKLIIFEDGVKYQLLDPKKYTYLRDHLQLTDEIDLYLESGGILVYCGFLGGLNNYSGGRLPGYYSNDHWFSQKYFGIDSVFQIGVHYYHSDPTAYPVRDSLTGFSRAVCPDNPSLSMSYALIRYPFPSHVQYFWDRLTPPAVGAFYPNHRGEITHWIVSRYPETSLIHSHPVGIKTESNTWTTYLFGFHLWYTEYEEARTLIDTIFQKAALPDIVPSNYITLNQNFPNPFNTGTKIQFYLPWRTKARLDIYNILGQRILILLDRTLDAGGHTVSWDGTDQNGRPLATGIYFYRLKSGPSSVARKMVLLK